MQSRLDGQIGVFTPAASSESGTDAAEMKMDHPKQRPADRFRRRRLLVPALLLALGVGSVLMLFANQWIHSVLFLARLEAMRTIGDIRTQSAIVHVWIEELVTGDTIDRHGIEGVLLDSERLLTSVADAEASDSWFDWYLNESGHGDDELRQSIVSATQNLYRFSDLSRLRLKGFDQGEDVGIGSKIDITYDRIFESLHHELDRLWTAMERRLARASTLDRLLSKSIALAWIAIVVLALGAVWNHERRRRQAELALRNSEAQLFQAQKMEALGRLAGGVAHDINNHLAAISMQCEAIKLGPEDRDQLHTRINAIISTASKSAGMIKRLLMLSRKQPVRPETINANDVIADLQGILDSLISENVQLEMRLTPNLANTTMDSSQLEQIILNLAVNACEAMTSGGHLLIESTNVTDKGSKWICLHVRDNGIGISDALLAKIFDPFFTTKDMAKNSGLGLASVDGIVRQNNGKIKVSSKPGKGTSFRVLLPATDRAVDRKAMPSVAVDQTETGGFGRTILLVEDNEDLGASTTTVLRSLGYQVHFAKDGETALDLFAELASVIDLAIVDVIMPGMDGKQLADRLRQQRPQLKVLFISGYTDNRLSQHGIVGEDVNLLAKPFTVKELVASVEALTARPEMASKVA